MRLAAIHGELVNSNYRAILPMLAMRDLGHDVTIFDRTAGRGHGLPDVESLRWFDVVHIHRQFDRPARDLVAALGERGVPVVWDNDDDLAALPKEAPQYRTTGGAQGRRNYAASVAVARLADLLTTPSAALADKYRGDGVAEIQVVENHLHPVWTETRPRPHEGVVIGWVAGLEHAADIARLGISRVLRRVLDEHPDVRVVSCGARLDLPERYTHTKLVDFLELAPYIAQFDIAIAPLADIPINHARSNVKLKEYAAIGVPWLASPVGPYRDMGTAQGGRLVAADAWFEAIDELVRAPRKRRRLAKKGRSWGRRQTIDHAAKDWEAAFERAIALRRAASALLAVVACALIFAGCGTTAGHRSATAASQSLASPFGATTATPPPDPHAGTELLASVAHRLRTAGFGVQVIPQRTGGRSTGLFVGPVHIWAYRDPADARREYDAFRHVASQHPPGRALAELHANRVYDISQPRRLTPDERTAFEKVVRVGEGR